MEAAGDKGFTIRLREPFPLLLEALAKIAGPPFIMPERLARTDPYQQVTETVGSGPYKFVKEEFQPGHMAIYVKNTVNQRGSGTRIQRPIGTHTSG